MSRRRLGQQPTTTLPRECAAPTLDASEVRRLRNESSATLRDELVAIGCAASFGWSDLGGFLSAREVGAMQRRGRVIVALLAKREARRGV